ncbi:MAG: 16S rRNA (cytidine(1402)-2'-O)-methyltransferase [Janthinobacterium lividum]
MATPFPSRPTPAQTALLNDPLTLAATQTYPPGLYLVATPIGNLADLTLRALHLLRIAERIGAEDTRHAAQLLNRFDLNKTVFAAHQHNEREAAVRIVAHIQAGERVAYISDAGTPGISDPGAKLVDAVREAGLPVIPIPGACALAAAISVAGTLADTFVFAGFLPTRAAQRRAALLPFVRMPQALVLYEAPHRIAETVTALREAFGDERRVLIARELTKLHESVHVCTLAEGPRWLSEDSNRLRGEFVLVVEGLRTSAAEDGDAAAHAAHSEHDRLLNVLLEELPVSAAARVAAKLTGSSRGPLYQRALAISQQSAAAADRQDDEAGNQASSSESSEDDAEDI